MEFARPIDSLTNPQPSFFDLLNQSNFEKLLIPLLLPNFPNRLTFFALKGLVDLVGIWKFGGVVSEIVYGIERGVRNQDITSNSNSNSNSTNGNNNIHSHNQISHSHGHSPLIIYLVTCLECHIIPYFFSKQQQPYSLNIPHKAVLTKIFKFLDVLVKICYITGDCQSFTLLHFLTGIVYKSSGRDIYERSDPVSRGVQWLILSGQLIVFLVQSGVIEKLKQKFVSVSNPDTAISAFKYTSTSTTPESDHFLSIAPKPHPKGFPIPLRAGLCPCCLNAWKDPVAVSTGFVYCKNCVKNSKTCPITNIPISKIFPLFI